jgi:segregation and condensation protein B
MVCFNGKSELPGKPMYYGTTKKFLEIFGLRNLRELPSLSEIDELIPEGIGDIEEKKETLSDITENMSEQVTSSYSEGEEELTKITDTLSEIDTSSEFFEVEKKRQKEKREAERARDIRDALALGEEVEDKDKRWLERYETRLAEEQAAEEVAMTVSEEPKLDEVSEPSSEDLPSPDDESAELMQAVESLTEEATGGVGAMMEQEEPTQPSSDEGSQIGNVDFGKLGEDMEIFNEESSKE